MLTLEERLRLLRAPEGQIEMVLDTDAYNEVDDQFAIAYALRAQRVILHALYAAPFHNARSTGPEDGMEKSYDEIDKLLKLANADIPLFKGSPRYLQNETTPVESPAARDLAARAMTYSTSNPLYVVAIGAITNVASALLMAPEIADRIVVVWLGGHAVEWPDTAEFNLQQDVAAARVVFSSGAPLVILPCNGVVSAFTTTGPELEHWVLGHNALADYLVRQTVEEANSYAAGRVWSRVIWDVTVMGWLLGGNDRFVKTRFIHTPIPEYDHHYAFDPRRPFCAYVYHIHRDALMGDLFATLTQ